MRVITYDNRPGSTPLDHFLRLSWMVWAHFQKFLGNVEEVHAAESWEDLVTWLEARAPSLSEVQYWGHGSEGMLWLGEKSFPADGFTRLRGKLAQATLFWFRTCSTFKGLNGHGFAALLCNQLRCRVAGHTRVIGLQQGGLHSLRVGFKPAWPVDEDDESSNTNTVSCLAMTFPREW